MNRIRELRKEANISQQNLSKIIGISQSNLATIERNETTPSVLIALDLSRYFGCSIEYLMGESDERNSNNDIKLLAKFKGERLEIIKKIADIADDELHDLNILIDILNKK